MIVFSPGREWLLVDMLARWGRGLLDALSGDELVAQACLVRRIGMDELVLSCLLISNVESYAAVSVAIQPRIM